MVIGYIVEYRLENVFTSISKRRRYSGTPIGMQLAKDDFKRGIAFIEGGKNPDYEEVSLYYQLDDGILHKVEHFDSFNGLSKPDYMGAYADG